jgi:hypothetical protein
MEEARWGAVLPGDEWLIPLIDADFLRFALKIVEHSRYLLDTLCIAQQSFAHTLLMPTWTWMA